MPAACAVEMIHAYSLVHDDLPAMDDDDLRRGRPTCHKVFGEATAILVGDALLARAFEVLASDVKPADRAARCCAVLAKRRGRDRSGWRSGSRSGRRPRRRPMSTMLESIHRRKTGALIAASLSTRRHHGRRLRRASSPRLKQFGRHLGLAFQITDDLLDVSGIQAAVGKRLAKDADRGKATYPRLLGIDESRRRAAELSTRPANAVAILRRSRRTAWRACPFRPRPQPLAPTFVSIDAMPTSPILPTIHSPSDLHELSLPQLERLATEMREVLCNLVSCRSAHFASNLGVVELCLALHQTFDFLHDRLIWDTGHQIYPHKLITGRYPQFDTMRTKGGLMGYPNPEESEYDLFMTGHAGSSVSTAIGLASGDALARPDEDALERGGHRRRRFPSGIVYEAMNNAGRSASRLLVVLNDNKMSICPRVGGMADYLDRLRMNRMYSGLKEEVVRRPGQGAAAGRSGRAIPGPTERSGQGRPARRHVLRRPRLPLLRPDRRPRHRPVAEISADGQAGRRTDPAARRHGKGPRLQAGRRRSGAVPRAAAVRAAGRPSRSHDQQLRALLHARRRRRHPSSR